MAIINCYLSEKLIYMKRIEADSYGRDGYEKAATIDGRTKREGKYNNDGTSHGITYVPVYYTDTEVFPGDKINNHIITSVIYNDILGVYECLTD